jgi:hypothetical protein
MDIEDRTRCELDAIEDYLQRLRAGGFLDVVDNTAGRAKAGAAADVRRRALRLVRDAGVRAPRLNKKGEAVDTGSRNLALWNGMRRLKRFDHRDLMVAAAIEISDHTAQNYCRALFKAGYLQLESKQRQDAALPLRARHRAEGAADPAREARLRPESRRGRVAPGGKRMNQKGPRRTRHVQLVPRRRTTSGHPGARIRPSGSSRSPRRATAPRRARWARSSACRAPSSTRRCTTATSAAWTASSRRCAASSCARW